MRRLTATILLTLLVASVALPLPVGRWECLDGTPCRWTPEGFHCPLKASSQNNLPKCCHKKVQPQPQRCQHGLLPVVARRHNDVAAVSAPLHCRFVKPQIARPAAVHQTLPHPSCETVAILLPLSDLSFLPPVVITLPREDSFAYPREDSPPRASRAPPRA